MTAPLRVLYVESGGTSGGSFESLYQYLAATGRHQVEPIVVLFVADSPYVAKFAAVGVEVVVLRDLLYSDYRTVAARWVGRLQAAVDLALPVASVALERILHRATVKTLAGLARERNVQIVHLNDQPSFNFFGFLLAERIEAPVISHMRSMRGIGFNRFKARFAGRVAARFVANSQKVAEHWRSKGLPAKKCRVLYNAVSIPAEGKTDVAIVDVWRQQSDAFVLACIANFLPEKGHAFLLDVLAAVKRRGIDLKVVLAGDGGLRADIERHAASLGVADMLHFAGYVTDATALMRAVDGVIVPSEREAFGRTIIEAMSVGVPVFATAVGGIPEVVEDNVTGVLVDYGDVEGATRRLVEFVEDRDARERYADAGRRLVSERFSMAAHVEGLHRVYSEVVL